MTRREFRDLAPPETVHETLADLSIAPDPDRVALKAAHGRTLAAHVEASIDVPGFDRAAMDGYAVRAADTVGASEADPARLSIAGRVTAGRAPDVRVAPSTAVEVATGAVMPDDADAVVPVERTVRDEGVAIQTAVAPGDHVTPQGDDIAAGDRALGPGTTLGPRHLGVLAAIGRETVPVRGRPTVAVVSTGVELVQVGEPLDPALGQIYDVNAHTIDAAAAATGARTERRVAPDDTREALRATLESAAAEADLLVTSGSTSAGTADRLHEIVADDGEVLVHGVAIKPGRPLLVGRVFETPYVGLPGYPVSALSVFRTFVAPRLRAATGRPTPETATCEATLRTRVRYDGGRRRLLAVGLVRDDAGNLLAYAPAGHSGATTTLTETDGIVEMPAERSVLPAGATVSVERFDETPIPRVLAMGDPDPALGAMLDRLDSRWLSRAVEDALRWLEDDVPDAVVGPADRLADRAVLACWEREWGLIADCDPPALEDLAGRRLATLDASLSLRAAFDRACEAAGVDPEGRALPGIESAARAVAADRADVGLALRATADRLDLAFRPLGTQRLAIAANPTRTDASERLAAALSNLEAVLADRPGYAVSED